MITVTRYVGNLTEEICFEQITDYAMYMFLTGSIERKDFLEFLHTH